MVLKSIGYAGASTESAPAPWMHGGSHRMKCCSRVCYPADRHCALALCVSVNVNQRTLGISPSLCCAWLKMPITSSTIQVEKSLFTSSLLMGILLIAANLRAPITSLDPVFVSGTGLLRIKSCGRRAAECASFTDFCVCPPFGSLVNVAPGPRAFAVHLPL